MRNFAIFCVFMHFCLGDIHAQYFNIISDHTGIDYSQDLFDCEQIASDLAHTLPGVYIDSFKVFEVGFYLHTNLYKDGYNKFITNVVSNTELSTPYYLIIVRIMNENRAVSTLRTILKLPLADSLGCVSPELVPVYASQVTGEIEAAYFHSAKSVIDWHHAEISGMQILMNIVSEKKVCCGGRSPSCSNCLSTELLEDYLETEGFNILEPTTVNYTPYYHVENNLEEYAKLEITNNSTTIDINNDVSEFVEELSSVFSQVRGTISYFNLDSCTFVLNTLQNREFEDPNKPYFDLQVLAYQINSTIYKIAYKFNTNIRFENGIGSHTIYIINLDNNLTTNKIHISAKYFLDLADLKDIHTELMTPNTTCDFGTTDGVVIINKNKSKVTQYAFNNYEVCDIMSEGQFIKLNNWKLDDEPDNPERTTKNFAFISTDPNDINRYYNDWDKGNPSNQLSSSYPDRIYRLLGFIILHSTSHMANYVHLKNVEDIKNLHDNEKLGIGYADSGFEIKNMILNISNNEKETFEKLIEWTKRVQPALIYDTKNRFDIH